MAVLAGNLKHPLFLDYILAESGAIDAVGK